MYDRCKKISSIYVIVWRKSSRARKKYMYDEEKKWDFLAGDNDVDDNLIDGGRSEQFMILKVNESQQYEVVTILRSLVAE